MTQHTKLKRSTFLIGWYVARLVVVVCGCLVVVVVCMIVLLRPYITINVHPFGKKIPLASDENDSGS